MTRRYQSRVNWVLPALLLATACSSSRSNRSLELSGPCGSFRDSIESCAERAGHGELGSLLYGIARCETGNKCVGHIDSPTGKFHGPFQFLSQTWRRECTALFARKHLAACQGKAAIYSTCCSTICASELVAHGGISNWPVCGKRAHGDS